MTVANRASSWGGSPRGRRVHRFSPVDPCRSDVGSLHPRPEGGSVPDNTANEHLVTAGPSTIAELLKDLEPMGDLSRSAIVDLAPGEEDEFFEILEDV